MYHKCTILVVLFSYHYSVEMIGLCCYLVFVVIFKEDRSTEEGITPYEVEARKENTRCSDGSCAVRNRSNLDENATFGRVFNSESENSSVTSFDGNYNRELW